MTSKRYNQISVFEGVYEKDSERLSLQVDGQPLDVLLDTMAPGNDIVGLIPTILGCDDENEARVVSLRLIPRPGETSFIPILMCPDDADFSCTLIVVESTGTQESVLWKRTGINATPWHVDPEKRLGQVTQWLAPIRPFEFERKQYESAFQGFVPRE